MIITYLYIVFPSQVAPIPVQSFPGFSHRFRLRCAQVLNEVGAASQIWNFPQFVLPFHNSQLQQIDTGHPTIFSLPFFCCHAARHAQVLRRLLQRDLFSAAQANAGWPFWGQGCSLAQKNLRETYYDSCEMLWNDVKYCENMWNDVKTVKLES